MNISSWLRAKNYLAAIHYCIPMPIQTNRHDNIRVMNDPPPVFLLWVFRTLTQKHPVLHPTGIPVKCGGNRDGRNSKVPPSS